MNQKPTEPEHLIREFWPRYQRAAIILTVGLQLVILAGIAGIFWYMDIFESHMDAFIIVVGTLIVLGGASSALLMWFLSRPVKHLIAAVIHVAGEPTATPPPNPNDRAFAKNGFRSILQTIYGLAAQAPGTPGAPQVTTTASAEGRVGPAITAPSQSALVEKALDDTLCGFVLFDQHRAITYANKATPVAVHTDGTTSLELLFNGEDTLDAWWNQCETNAVKAERTWSRISNKLPNEEGRRFFDVIASYDKGAESEMVLVLVDRTHLYSIGEEELDFIAFAAHELRGPITVIRGYLDVLQTELDTVLADDQKELFRRLEVSANRLSGYINNILNTSRFDRRHLKMRLVETTVAAVYDTVRDDMALRASSQGRLLSVAIPDDLPTVPADTASLGEVFANLIDNAIKYSNEGGAIAVSAQLRGDVVDVNVVDHGIGMPGNVVGNLFQKFYRSHRSRETVAGTGIGLYISKAIVESHGGTISVKSDEGQGSTFTISLPTYRSVAQSLQSQDNANDALLKQAEAGVYIKNHSSFRG